jgi:hypothetical protein
MCSHQHSRYLSFLLCHNCISLHWQWETWLLLPLTGSTYLVRAPVNTSSLTQALILLINPPPPKGTLQQWTCPLSLFQHPVLGSSWCGHHPCLSQVPVPCSGFHLLLPLHRDLLGSTLPTGFGMGFLLTSFWSILLSKIWKSMDFLIVHISESACVVVVLEVTHTTFSTCPDGIIAAVW